MADYDENPSLESTNPQEPDLDKIAKELRDASSDATSYLQRMGNVRGWWQCEWPGQTIDGRRWALSESALDRVFPWNGCSDSRLRTVATIIQEHVMFAMLAFRSAKVSTQTPRTFPNSRDSAITQKMLTWCVYTQMWRDLLRELPMAFGWKYGNGLAFLGVEWEQQRELSSVPITLEMLSQLTQALGLDDITIKIMDPYKAYDDDLVTVLQSISPILPKGDVKKVLNDLRTLGAAQLPVASLRVNRPKWTALRPFVDVWFPSETSDIQQARWVAVRELVSESELTDRIVTDGYDPDFVEEALEHKGRFSGLIPRDGYAQASLGSDRDLVELFVFRSRYLDNGVPCLYKTVLCLSQLLDDNSKPLYAIHRKDEYAHQQYPVVGLRRSYVFRPLLSSIGISEEAYTDELDIKKQQDGLNDRTDLIHQPPMITHTLRAQAVANTYQPRAVMTSMRPDQVIFPQLPPMDQTPVLVMQFVMERLNRRYPLTNAAGLDPQLVSQYRQQLGLDTLGELELAFDQTLQLGEQYWSDEEWMAVTGGQKPQRTPKDIQQQYTVSATTDMTLADPEVAKNKLAMMAQLLPFKDAGGLVFNAAANIVDSDLADLLTQDQMSPTAMKKEKDDEFAAWGQILAGLVPQKPLMANNQLRLQTIGQEIMTQPTVQSKMQQDPNLQKVAEDRIKFFQNQIQQYQVNPTIGRTLAVQPFQPGAMPNVTNAQAAQ